MYLCTRSIRVFDVRMVTCLLLDQAGPRVSSGIGRESQVAVLVAQGQWRTSACLAYQDSASDEDDTTMKENQDDSECVKSLATIAFWYLILNSDFSLRGLKCGTEE